MWIMLATGSCYLYVRPGRQLGKCGEYRMRRSESGLFSYSKLRRWQRPSLLIMYRRIRAIWVPANLVASTVPELDDTLPRFTDN
jgi:hypothetical protein